MDKSQTRRIVVLSILMAGLCAVAQGKIIYVEDNIAWVDDGASWISAFTHLQDALAVAEAGDEIRVAQGLYRPDRGAGLTPGDRDATFRLPDGVVLAGGYAGLFAVDPNARDVARYVTMLSGDLFNNDADLEDPCDLYSDPTRRDNSLHVVTAEGVGVETVLDGFVMTGGHTWPERRGRGGGGVDPEAGAGLYIASASPVVGNCVFMRNAAGVGGGVYVDGGLPTISECLFSTNGAYDRGGGLSCDADLLELAHCTFERNFAADEGGGLHCDADTVRLLDCTFTENSAAEGGGMMSSVHSHLDLKRCAFKDNAAFEGAGLNVRAFSRERPVMLTDCTFSGNRAEARFARPGSQADGATPCGGGLLLSSAQAELEGCAFMANIAEKGGGLDVSVGDRCRLTNCLWTGHLGGAIYARTGAFELDRCTLYSGLANGGGLLTCGFGGRAPADVGVTVTNSILRDEYGEFRGIDGGPEDIAITFSNVEGGWPGEGNIDVEPHFVSPGGWTRYGNAWVQGDYHLKSQAGRWDPIGRSWAYDDVTSFCIDAGNPNDSLGDELFPDGGAVNMGAYAGTIEASKSYFGQPLWAVNLAGDVNGDCRVNIDDLLTILSQWLPAGPLVEQERLITFLEPVDGAILEMDSEPLVITAEIGDPETIVNVVFHVSHTEGTFSYHGQCEGQQWRNRWSGQWYWSGDTDRLSSGEHVIVVTMGAAQAEQTPVSWEWSQGSYTLPEGEYVISTEVIDDKGRTIVSPERMVTLVEKPRRPGR